MRLLVVGSGGREHALVWKLKQGPKVEKIFCAPGNSGIAEQAECIPVKAEDIETLLKAANVGPRAPLTLGIVDSFQQAGLRIFFVRMGSGLQIKFKSRAARWGLGPKLYLKFNE